MGVVEKPYLGGSVEIMAREDPYRDSTSTNAFYPRTKIVLFYRGRGVEITKAAYQVLLDLFNDPGVVEKLKDWE